MSILIKQFDHVRPSTSSYRICARDTIRNVDWDDWNRLRDPKSDPHMDPRFILAVENSMRKQSRFCHVLIYDQLGDPVAAACLSSLRIDGALLAQGRSQRAAAFVNRLTPGLLGMRILMCGLPISAGASHLRFAPHVDRAAVLGILDVLLHDLARSPGSECILFKEFGAEQSRELAPLEALGYRRADSLPMNCAPVGYGSFEDYVSRVKSSRRHTIRHSREKFLASGLKVINLLGGEGVDRLFTDDVHQLYRGVFDRAAVRFEELPAEFFREVARQLPDSSLFTFIYEPERIRAFAMTLFSEELSHQMFIGLDYEVNAQCDLYFNLFFESLDAAFARGPNRIYVGQASDDFKHQKLSTFQVPLSVYFKGCKWAIRKLIAWCPNLFFPPRPLKYPA
jgi:predicted N-acyltransferase